MSKDDLDYLQRKDAFTIPGTELRKELLRSHIQHVHGYLPLMDVCDFLPVFDMDNKSLEPISLLLFQAVMFTGTAFIEPEHLQRAGFESRKVARKALFQRVKLLFDLVYEENQISRVQALLLMTYWNDMPETEYDTWHWMSLSLALARTISLHRNPEIVDTDVLKHRLRKRIWWSCLMRERMIAFGMRKPTRIGEDDFDVPMLTFEDFDTTSQVSGIARALQPCPVLQESKSLAQMARMCLEEAKLCLLIGRVLDSQYSAPSLARSARLTPKISGIEPSEVFQCDRDLQVWLEELPSDVRYATSPNVRANSAESVALVHRAMLKMAFLAISSTLHRPQVLSVASDIIAPELTDLSRRRVLHAATEIATIANELHMQDLSRFLPTSGVTVIVPAISVHLQRAKSRDAATRHTSLRLFHQGMKVLNSLRETYISADVAALYLEAAVHKLQLTDSSVLASFTPTASMETAGISLITSSLPAQDVARTLIYNSTLNTHEILLLSDCSQPLHSIPGSETKVFDSSWVELMAAPNNDMKRNGLLVFDDLTENGNLSMPQCSAGLVENIQGENDGASDVDLDWTAFFSEFCPEDQTGQQTLDGAC